MGLSHHLFENLFMRFFILFIAVLSSLAANARPSAGPMLGPVTRHTATVWIQGSEPDRVALEIDQPDNKVPGWRTQAVQLKAEAGYIARFDLDSLAPGTRYRYRIVWNGKLLDSAHHFKTQSSPGPDGLPEITVYLGSCAHLHDPSTDGAREWSGGYEILDQIAARAGADSHHNLMLWLGDNIYLRPDDYEHPSGMASRYRKVRSHAAMQKLLPALPHYAIWDDHDYGPNNHNQSFVFKQASLDLFRQYWPNPSAGLPDMPGNHTQFSVADMDFFLLDNRWNRDSDHDQSDNRKMFGVDQMHWLKNALMASRARFKIIAGGSQFLNDLSRHEGWHHFREERRDFLSWLELNNISGVLFLSGDRHHTELLKQERPGNYPLFELTCSPLTSRPHSVETTEANHPARVEGTLVEARNYCTLNVQGNGDDRMLAVRSLDARGNPFWEVRMEAGALRRTGSPARLP
ncbi:MAG: alkaline phosphatase D family protein [Hydrogenophilaceae bacterium]|nr:alkaline phosphatase D family protein [Hydrogenophilaceae bacterium]